MREIQILTPRGFPKAIAKYFTAKVDWAVVDFGCFKVSTETPLKNDYATVEYLINYCGVHL